MKEKQYDPAGNNEQAPAKGMAAVNTHNTDKENTHAQDAATPEEDSREKVNNKDNDRQ